MRQALVVALVALAGCNPQRLLRAPPPPEQSGVHNPLSEEGHKSFEQRKRDCWDMPNAQACYEVGADYELGANVPRDKREARKYYDKACELEREPEHCQAAKRLAVE